MPDPALVSHVVHFGVFEADLRSGELRKHGLKVKSQEQPFRVLADHWNSRARLSRARSCARSSGRLKPLWI